MKVDTNDLISAIDAARLLGVMPNVISNWQQRLDFPASLATVAGGKVKLFSRHEVLDWYIGRLHPDVIAEIRARGSG